VSEIKVTGRSLTKKVRTAEEEYIDNEYGWLVDKTVQEVRPLTPKEIRNLGWYAGTALPFVVWFTDGSCVIPMADEEGNAPGALLWQEGR
jgi:hypothetical protein